MDSLPTENDNNPLKQIISNFAKELIDNNSKLDWKRIAQTLDKHLFFNKKTQKSNLQKAFATYCETTAESIDWEYFKRDVCAAYYNKNDQRFMFYDVLSNQLKYHSLTKRHQFYHILLHQYLKLSDLEETHIIQILYILTSKYNQTITVKDVENVVVNNKINGVVLKKMVGGKCDYNKLSEKFSALNIQTANWKIIYGTIKFWKLNVSELTKVALPKVLVKCRRQDIIIIAYIIGKQMNANSDSKKPIHPTHIKKVIYDNHLNGQQISIITEDEFIERAKLYTIQPKEASLLLVGIKKYFERNDNIGPHNIIE
eukprot:202686_1